MEIQMLDLKTYIKDVPGFPKEGIIFRDISPLLADPQALSQTIDMLAAPFDDGSIDCVAAIEARGFIFGSAVARRLGVGMIPIRKQGKLPCKTESVTYSLEYGSDTLEVHADAFAKYKKVLMVDDLLATGGTMTAACELVEKVGGEVVGLSFLIELGGLGGREKLSHHKINSLIAY